MRGMLKRIRHAGKGTETPERRAILLPVALVWLLLIILDALSRVPLQASDPDFVFTLTLPATTVEVQLQVDVDHQPLADVQRPRFEALFAHLDHDNNQWLDADELKAAPSAGWLRRVAWGYLPANHTEPVVLAEADLDRNDVVSRAELQAWYARHGVGSLTAVAARSSMTPVLTAALWRHLDTDRDSRLSLAEIAAAPESLRKLDEDDDELISSQEIASSVKQPYPFPTGRLDKLHFDVAARRDPHTTTRLPILVKLSLAPSAVQGVTLPTETADISESAVVATPLINGISFNLGDCPCSFVAARGASQHWREFVEPLAWTHFTAADQNNDQSVTAEEASTATNRTVLALFRFADRNQDGNVTRVEWTAALQVLRRLTEANVHFVVLCHDHALFELLDVNRDGYLSRAELRAASSLLRATIKDDLPTAVTLIVSLGKPSFPLGASSAESPKWFTAMDRNQDGVVSRFEFIGETHAFHRLDRNQDGRLSQQEANHQSRDKSRTSR